MRPEVHYVVLNSLQDPGRAGQQEDEGKGLKRPLKTSEKFSLIINPCLAIKARATQTHSVPYVLCYDRRSPPYAVCPLLHDLQMLSTPMWLQTCGIAKEGKRYNSG